MEKQKKETKFEDLEEGFIRILRNSYGFNFFIASKAGEELREEFFELTKFGKLAPDILKLKLKFKKIRENFNTKHIDKGYYLDDRAIYDYRDNEICRFPLCDTDKQKLCRNKNMKNILNFLNSRH